jgi:hypothetical protein
MVLLDNAVRLETRLIPVGKSQAAADLGRALRRWVSHYVLSGRVL